MLNFRILTRILPLFVGLIFCLGEDVFPSWPQFWLSSDCFLDSAQGTQTTASVAFDGTNFLVVWEDERINTKRDIFAARVSSVGDLLDPIGIPICISPGIQSNANLAWGSENYLVVWQDWRNGNWAIYGSRVDPEGNISDPDGFLIAGGSEWALYPDVAWDGTNFFVVWSHDKPVTSYDIYGTRITPDGEVLDPDGILICATYLFELSPSVAYNGSVYFVTWEHSQG